MIGMYNRLPVRIQRGMFENEYTITLNVHSRHLTAVVNKESVIVSTPPTDEAPGEGFVRVRVLGVDDGSALVDLPRPAFTSTPRLKVPEEVLRPG